MGMGDCETKKAIVTVLKEAWDKWVDGASHWTMSNAQDTAEKRSYNTYDNDTEYDPVETVMEYESMGNPENIFELRTCETFAKEFYDDLKKGIFSHNKCSYAHLYHLLCIYSCPIGSIQCMGIQWR